MAEMAGLAWTRQGTNGHILRLKAPPSLSANGVRQHEVLDHRTVPAILRAPQTQRQHLHHGLFA